MNKPEKKVSLRQMEKERDGEWDHLRARMATLVETLETDPGEWIGEHPYAATGSAALAGFVVAQFPLPRMKSKPKHDKRAVKRDDDESHDRDEHRSSLMTLLASLAQQYLAHGGSRAPEAQQDGVVTVADGGAVCGAAFPTDFSSRTTESSDAAPRAA